MSDVIVNRVSESLLTTIDLEEYLHGTEWMAFDLKPFLFMELILKEKDYREALKQHDWSVYENKYVHIECSADAIIPMWAFMLAATNLEAVAKMVFFGDVNTAKQQFILQQIEKTDPADYADKRVVVKGCGDFHVGEAAYVSVTAKLRPVVKSIMYGEPCSTVPIYKAKKTL